VAVGIALTAAAALLLGLTLWRVPGPTPAPSGGPELFPEANYVWEEDEETFGSLAVVDLQDRILEEL